uniref:Vacuolar protein sorting-associated protein 52 homolog n=1 Tax=Chromera velia CCMP2878 TaxID=1169474 RepID=A0A0G4FCE6_9ALVE|eukprot:Cvel_16183.t1-p1 / transcript=Cvel_16183.t1 / gene=Cvel_16183 / organism=Chromera_velia_CCMP2878 / gene_product=Vacuolar protein sorting-associated protein 52, putative / transcript_product=Vacuolar protein sorting-associated protein 52, putative / location=Cvel_scaffold1234:42881-49865(-) / protein_length=848 / sequence_SO=supercontig / SO=protein_coding / is_pseudo=false
MLAENGDYTKLRDLLEKYHDHPIVQSALHPPETQKDFRKHLGKHIRSIEEQMHRMESEVVSQYLKSSDSLLALHREAANCETILSKMEDLLSDFQKDLTGISSQIRKLQTDSMTMNIKLQNRKSAHEVLSAYLDQIVVTPQLIKTICDGEVNERYLEALEELTRKLEHARQPGMQEHPASAASVPELEKLESKAVARVRDFLVAQVNLLKKPRTNIQIIQQNVLLRCAAFNHFLAEHHPPSFDAVKQTYTGTMSRILQGQFKTYALSLGKLNLDTAPTKTDLLGAPESGIPAGATLGGFLGLSKPSAILQSRGNVFSMAGRDSILDEIAHESPPVVPSTQSVAGRKLYHEQLFRAEQVLLADTATSETQFLRPFFGVTGQALSEVFQLVMGRSLQASLESLENFLFGCHDALCLLLMLRVVEGTRHTLAKRRIDVLAGYLKQVEALVEPRFRLCLQRHAASLGQASTPSTVKQLFPQATAQGPMRSHPHFVSRRVAEFLAALQALSAPLEFPSASTSGREREVGGLSPLPPPAAGRDRERPPPTPQWQAPMLTAVLTLGTAYEQLVMTLSSELSNVRDREVFVINNVDLVISVLEERRRDKLEKHADSRNRRTSVDGPLSPTLARSSPPLPSGPSSSSSSSAVAAAAARTTSPLWGGGGRPPPPPPPPSGEPASSSSSSSSTAFVGGEPSSSSSSAFGTVLQRLETRLREQVGLFVEALLEKRMKDLIAFVKKKEALGEQEEGGEKGGGGAPSDLETRQMERLVRMFAADWLKAMEEIQKEVMGAFTNFNCGAKILKQALAQLLLYYSRFQRILQTALQSAPSQPAFFRDLVPNSTLLSEIKKHSKAF